MGFSGVTAQDLLTHLLERYGIITTSDEEENRKKMSHPYDTSQMIDEFFKIIEDGVQYSDDSNMPFTSDQIIHMAYMAVYTTSMYTDACKEWRKLAVTDQTCPRFKKHFP